MKRAVTIFAVAALVLTVSGVLVGQSEPFNGTWKLNVAKSKFSPGLTLKSDSRTYESSLMASKSPPIRVTGDGSTQSYSISAKYDGRDCPIAGQGPFGADSSPGAQWPIPSHSPLNII
jgi:hypothetical protein